MVQCGQALRVYVNLYTSKTNIKLYNLHYIAVEGEIMVTGFEVSVEGRKWGRDEEERVEEPVTEHHRGVLS